jgi:hypothetical protein
MGCRSWCETHHFARIDGLGSGRATAHCTAAAPSLNSSYEPVNLYHFTVPDMSQIKDLRPPETPKIEKIHILYGG